MAAVVEAIIMAVAVKISNAMAHVFLMGVNDRGRRESTQLITMAKLFLLTLRYNE